MQNTPYMSFSRHNLYKRCPKAYWYKYVAKMPDPYGPENKLGSFAHEVLEKLYNQKDRSLEAAKNICAELWEKSDYPQQRETVEIKTSIWEIMQNFYELQKPQEDTKTYLNELRLEAECAGVTITGIIDRVDQTNNVLADYKTGKYKTENKKQLDLYSALYNNFGYTETKVELIYCGNKEQRIVEHVSTGERQKEVVDELCDAYEEIISLDEEDSVQWQARTGWACNGRNKGGRTWCNFMHVCPMYNEPDW